MNGRILVEVEILTIIDCTTIVMMPNGTTLSRRGRLGNPGDKILIWID